MLLGCARASVACPSNIRYLAFFSLQPLLPQYLEVLLLPSPMTLRSFRPVAETGTVIQYCYTHPVQLESFAPLHPQTLDPVPGPQIDTQETY